MTDSQNLPRVAVITGASSGIGAATARTLHADGYHVALLARRLDRIEALAAELGDGVIAIPADVTDRGALVAAAQRVQDELGGADVLVNNAGTMLLGPFSSERRDDYRNMIEVNMIEVNLLGAITATEVFLDQLKDGGGDLINISSVAGRTARPLTASTPPPSGASTAGPNRFVRNCCPTSASPSLNRGSSTPNYPATSPTRPPGRLCSGATTSLPSSPRRSPRSSPSPSPGLATSSSTRSCSAPPPNSADACPELPVPPFRLSLAAVSMRALRGGGSAARNPCCVQSAASSAAHPGCKRPGLDPVRAT